VLVLLDFERRGPALLDRVPQAVERAHTGVAAPGEHQFFDAACADELVVDHIGGHADHGQVAALLANNLMARRKRDQMSEPFKRDGVAVLDEFLNGFFERDNAGQLCSTPNWTL
jgi:hypothetical protein